MFDRMFETLHFAFRQRAAFNDAIALLRQLLTFKVPFRKIFASFLAVIEMFSAAFWDTPRTPRGPELDLFGYELVFEEEFNGDALDTDIWEINTSQHRMGWYTADQLRTENGNLIMSCDYQENGPLGAGWYLSDIAIREQYCKGYFEIRCKVLSNQARNDFWSAFWITVPGEYDPEISKGGIGGCEIDILESFSDNSHNLNYPVGITPAIWCNGVDDDDDHLDGINLGQWKSNDPVNEFNTYGMMWTDDYYIWYINGVEAFRVNYGSGPSQVPEQVKISLSVPSCAPEKLVRQTDQSGDYVVDYVRIWQIAD